MSGSVERFHWEPWTTLLPPCPGSGNRSWRDLNHVPTNHLRAEPLKTSNRRVTIAVTICFVSVQSPEHITVAVTGIAQCGIHWQSRRGDLRFTAWLPDRSNRRDDRRGCVSIASIDPTADARSDVASIGAFDRKVGRMTEVNGDSRVVRVPLATPVEEPTFQQIRSQVCTDPFRPKPIFQPAG